MRPFPFVLLVCAFVLAACTSKGGEALDSLTPGAQPSPVIPVLEAQDERVDPATATKDTTSTDEPDPTATESRDDVPPRGAASEFSTDFSRHSVPYGEILSGGPPKDGIRAIDEPQFIGTEEAGQWLQPEEPVVLVQVGEQARAYPLQIFMWHEIVNDTVGDLPLVVTFCPLCNTAIAFERTFEGQVLDFGTTGRLRYSNLIMYDRQTQTWWQQASGEAIVGEHTGAKLTFYPATIISWGDFMTAYPQGSVLSRDTGFNRPYGSNPYPGYDNVDRSPFAYQGPETPGVLPAMARVLTVDRGVEAVAYPYNILKDVLVVNDRVGDEHIVVFWQAGTASSLDASTVSGGRDVGSAAAFRRQVDGRSLTFELTDNEIRDLETGSTWNILGQATAGELTGLQLEPVIAINHFWFSWAAFKPETRIYRIE